MFHSRPDNAQRVERFIAGLDTIPWFSNLGQPTPPEAGVERIYRWEDWPGLEEPGIIDLSQRHQALYDSLIASAEGSADARKGLWDRIHAAVFRAAAPNIPYDPKHDTYHGPTMAVWQAAWTAGLIGLCLQSGRPAPPELREQWDWFARGHWPCGYAGANDDGKPGPLLVY